LDFATVLFVRYDRQTDRQTEPPAAEHGVTLLRGNYTPVHSLHTHSA